MWEIKEEYDLATEEIDVVVKSKRKNFQHMHEMISKKIKDTAKAKRTFRLREGFGGFDNPYTLEEIGDVMGLTRERVRQIREKALQKLREPGKNMRLKEFTAN